MTTKQTPEWKLISELLAQIALAKENISKGRYQSAMIELEYTEVIFADTVYCNPVLAGQPIRTLD